MIEEALASNLHTAVIAFQFKRLDEEYPAAKLALTRPNMSLYARNGAIIFGVKGEWRPGQPPTNEWNNIRSTFWKNNTEGGEFLLGDFATLSRFFALTQSDNIIPHNHCNAANDNDSAINKLDMAVDDNA